MLPCLRKVFAGFLLSTIYSSHLWSATCLTTLPPNPPFTPPAPQRAIPAGQFFWYGTEALWTTLPISGAWNGLHPYSSETKGYRQKVFWWRQGYNAKTEQKPKLIVTGRRLDGDAPSFAVSDATNAYAPDIGSAMLVGIDIPTHGCWEITGHYSGHTLTFIVSVEP
jgi:hypothetical protein